MPVAAGPSAWSAGTSCGRTVWNSGARPQRTAVATLTARVKPSTRASSRRGRSTGSDSAVRNGPSRFGRVRMTPAASAAPAAAGDEDEHQALGDELAQEASARRAERPADGDLAATDGGAGEQQAGDVDAGDEEQQAGQGEEQRREDGGRALQQRRHRRQRVDLDTRQLRRADVPHHGVGRRLRLRQVHPRRQARDELEPDQPAIRQIFAEVELAVRAQRHEELGGEAVERAVEPLR